MSTSHTSYQLIALLNLLQEKKCTPDQFQKLFSSGVFSSIFDPKAIIPPRQELQELFGFPLETVLVMNDKSHSLPDLAEKGGIGFISKKINLNEKKFKLEGLESEWISFDLYCSPEDISGADAKNKMLHSGNPDHTWKPASLMDLLKYKASFNENRHGFPIVALGTIIEIGGVPFCPYIIEDATKTSLKIAEFNSKWRQRCRFLRVSERKFS